MSTGINIHAGADEPTIEALADAIAKILEAGNEFRMDQSTVKQALETLMAGTRSVITNTSINNSNIITKKDKDDE